MKHWQAVKKWLADGCVWFTVFALILLLFSLTVAEVTALSCVRFLLLFPSALCFSLAGLLRHSKKLPLWVGVSAHYIIDALSVFLFLYLPVSGTQAATRLLMFVLISVVYWIIVGIVTLVKSRIRKLMEED